MLNKPIRKSLKPRDPTRLITISFALVILTGTLLLTLPISSKAGTFTGLLDCFFTATSATCVTGLIVVDTYTHWTLFGQCVILLLIQIGGLGLVTFTTFFNIALGKKLGFKSLQLAQESINSSSFMGINKLVMMIIKASLSFELIGAILLSTVFIPKYGASGIFISIFLAISAFCNAGFDILGRETPFTSLVNYNNNPIVLGTIMALIIIGGLGFIVWHDLYKWREEHRLSFHTKLVLSITAALIVTGFIAFALCEWNNPLTMGPLPIPQKLGASLFQSVTCRTAGFNSIDNAAMTPLGKLISTCLMFIGAAPGSTGGGIKVTTFAVIVFTVVSVVKGRDDAVIMHRRVDKRTVYKALSVVILAMTAIVGTVAIIYFTNLPTMPDISGLDIIFETVSAFGTVGLTVGLSGTINAISHVVLALLMYMGRVGPVSLAYSLAVRQQNNRHEVVPEAKILIG